MEEKKNLYLVAVKKFFSGYQYFEIEAVNKKEAIEKTKQNIVRYGNGNYSSEDIKVVKKINKKKG